MTTTLGLNSYFEHPAVAVVRDGEVLFAAEDERFTGIKHGRKYSPYRTYVPVDAIHRALTETGLSLGDIDEVGYSYHRWAHLFSLWGCFTGHRMDAFSDEFSAFMSLVHVRTQMRRGYEIPGRYRSRVDPGRLGAIPYREWRHHLSHAASAFFCSGYPRALTFVADGAGERTTTSVYLCEGRQLRRIGGTDLPHSLGIAYSLVTRHLGFEAFEDEFKVMGLAGYGEPTFADECGRLVQLGSHGTFRVDQRLLRNLSDLFGPARAPDDALKQRHMNVARSIQDRLEAALIHMVRYHIAATGVRQICLAGGTFLNCVANGKVAAQTGADAIFVQPAAHDGGTALGAAALSSVRRGGDPQLSFASAALGTSYSSDQLAAVCDGAGLTYRCLPEPDLTRTVADRLSAGEIGGVFRGRMEFGPRALGNRSVLASPVRAEMKDRLNQLKGREAFRPVAPMVIAEAFDEYFDGVKNRYMLFTAHARDRALAEMPGAVHVDGTARVQTIWREHDPWIHGLLSEFAEHTRVPALINTSLNVRGKPIVESPHDALACLFTTGMDFLLLGDLLVDKPR